MFESSRPAIRAAVFDVGETLVDETQSWGDWADWLHVPRFTFFAVLGGVIERGEHHRRVFELLRPGFDHAAARRQRLADGWRYEFTPADFYPDAVPCLQRLKVLGLRIGIAGNQPVEAARSLEECGVGADFIVTSQGLGFEKPDPRFFAEVIRLAGEPDGSRVAYIGDRLDNDVIPAAQAGMFTVFLKRGPWAHLQASQPGAARAVAEIHGLCDLPALLCGDASAI